MTRIEFIQSLRNELRELPPEEIVAATQFYEEYFDEALDCLNAENVSEEEAVRLREETEAKLIEEIGSPKAAAKRIRAEHANKLLEKDTPGGGEKVSTERKRSAARWAIIGICSVSVICIVIGLMTGGIQNRIDRITESPEKRSVNDYVVADFSSIYVAGDAELWIVGEEFYKKVKAMGDEFPLEESEMALLNKNKVLVVGGDRIPQPSISVQDEILHIETSIVDESYGGDMNWTQSIVICTSEEDLESFKTESVIGSVNILGISLEEGSIDGYGYGDVYMEGVTGKNMVIQRENGSIHIDGDLTGTINAHTESGDVELNGKPGGDVDLSTSSGQIRVSGEITGSVDAHTEDGDVELGGKSGGDVKLSSSSGEIRISGEITGSVDAHTEDGDVELGGKPGGDVNLSSSSGEIRVSGELRGSINAHTENGDININTYYERKEYSLDAHTGSGSIKVTEAGRDVPVRNDIEEDAGEGAYEGFSLHEEGGSNKISATTESGNVTLNFDAK